MAYILIGTLLEGTRGQVEQNRIEPLRRLGRVLRHYAIYKTRHKDRRFHNATDPNFLIEHRDDPYWLNRGIAST